MRIGSGEHAFEWIENWVVIPDTPESRVDGRTHGVVVTREGHVVVFHVANPAILVFDAQGSLIDAWGDRFPGAHGLTLVEEAGTEYLWLTDYKTGEVVKTTLKGETVLSLPRPDFKGYDDPEMYIADRMNRRIQVYDTEGKFKRVVSEGADTSACAFIPYGEFTLIP